MKAWKLALALTFASAGLASTAAAASPYPARPVSIVVGFAAGGSTDMLARTLAKELSDKFHQSFIVENKPGANSNVAHTYVARANPDGYTLLMVPFGLAVNEYLYKDLRYKLDDFAPIALVAQVPNVLVVNKNLPFNNVKAFVDYSKAHPTEITYGSPGVGSSLHLAGELFRYATGAEMLHVPFNGSGPALMAVRSGEVKSAFDNLSTAAPMIKSGDLKALAVTSSRRSDAFPDLPTIAESGYPEYEISSYFGLAAPAGTPPAVVDTLNQAVMEALKSPAIQAQFKTLGAYAQPNTPAQFSAFLHKENQKWRDVIKASGLKPD
ncbi:Bug family tripartite tricarboxylate transporter substrate binding protein [Achromobacter aloeverae]|uniref:MFS transporter n=1 Tax=Achromobacter aloeverae TaxID=1750518 RepID=A0A4Q1HNG4_9BURK|nr:tripartite tricarboxylate transporter substrate binding protein [Achromobacter aloeverae]RXN92327.1 MFS transporter [Achromobacter aloeverae]